MRDCPESCSGRRKLAGSSRILETGRKASQRRTQERMALTLIGTITERARRSFMEDIDNSDDSQYDRWIDHWFKTADSFLASLEEEGLTETALKVRVLIDEQRTFLARFNPTT